MSLNGYLPEGATLATLDMLQQANLAHVRAPELSRRAGTDVYVRIRTIRRAAYLQMLPPPPSGAEAWPPEESAQRYEAWFRELPHDEQASRRKLVDDVTFKVLVAGLVEPRVTLDTAQDLGDDADTIAVEILRFSGLLPEAPAAAAAAQEAAPA